MIKKKLCLLGAFGVGKTSLIRKYVLNVYSEKYLSTVGVKIDKKLVRLNSGREVTLLIWDLEGHEDVSEIAQNYLQGMSGYFLVADGTRLDTVKKAQETQKKLEGLFPGLPTAALMNKRDLEGEWSLRPGDISFFTAKRIRVLETSAKTGLGVEEGFQHIAQKMVDA